MQLILCSYKQTPRSGPECQAHGLAQACPGALKPQLWTSSILTPSCQLLQPSSGKAVGGRGK